MKQTVSHSTDQMGAALHMIQAQVQNLEQALVNMLRDSAEVQNTNNTVFSHALQRMEAHVATTRRLLNLNQERVGFAAVPDNDGLIDYKYYEAQWYATLGFAEFISGLKKYAETSRSVVLASGSDVTIFGGD